MFLMLTSWEKTLPFAFLTTLCFGYILFCSKSKLYMISIRHNIYLFMQEPILTYYWKWISTYIHTYLYYKYNKYICIDTSGVYVSENLNATSVTRWKHQFPSTITAVKQSGVWIVTGWVTIGGFNLLRLDFRTNPAGWIKLC